MVRYDWLVVGAGFSGATLAERIASQLDQRVLIVDRREHIGGNAYDSLDEAGIRVHRYGAHIFHTRSTKVWSYLSQFTDWYPYVHRVKASIDGKLVPLPFNLESLHALVHPTMARRLEACLLSRFGEGGRVPVLRLMENANYDLQRLAALVSDQVFDNYTRKQWGLRPDELDRSVTGRVPIVVSRDDRYFGDPHQGMPAGGYTALFERMLAHPNIDIALGVDHADVQDQVRHDRLVFTGEIDAFFGFAHGPLPYRSLRFEHRSIDEAEFQPTAVVNHPNEHDYTRIIEHKHFSGGGGDRTTITYEYPQDYVRGDNEPYYPVPRQQNHLLYERYAEDALSLEGKVVFAGRLARYRYLDMDQAVSQALVCFRQQVVPLVTGRPADAPVAALTGA